MKHLSLFALMLAAVGTMAGCNSDPCSRGKACSADPEITDSDRQACKQQLDSVKAECRSKAEAYANCAADNVKCGSDNKTDVEASGSAVSANCKTKQTELLECLGSSTGDGGGSSGDAG